MVQRALRIGRATFVCSAIAIVIGLVPAAAGAERVVLCEEFSATWCGYCPYSGGAIDQMMAEYPDTLAVVEYHIDDGYQTDFGNSRYTFYSVSGLPTVWLDGMLEMVGAYTNIPQQYDWYNGVFHNRQAVDTDITIDLYGEQVSGQDYQLTAIFKMEPTGTAKTLRMHMAACLNHYPNESYYRNTFRQRTLNADVSLTPGETVKVVRDITFDTASWASPEDIVIVCWLRENLPSAPCEIFQACQMNWPFPAPPPDYALGDLNCSGAVDLFDIDPFVLAVTSANETPAFGSYEAAYPGCDAMLADVDESGTVDLFDIDPMVELLTQ